MNEQVSCQKVSLKVRCIWSFRDVKYWFVGKIQRFALNLIHMTTKDSNYKKHAQREFTVLKWQEDDMQKWVCHNLLDLLAVFATQGHSGTSAPYVVGLFSDLALFKILSPLTGEDEEWNDVSESCYQNNRCSHVFKDKSEKGVAYDIEGKVFREANGCCYTNRKSRVSVKFPYTPKREYIDLEVKPVLIKDKGTKTEPLENSRCHTCGEYIPHSEIAQHRETHKTKNEDCEITYRYGDTYLHPFSEQEDK